MLYIIQEALAATFILGISLLLLGVLLADLALAATLIFRGVVALASGAGSQKLSPSAGADNRRILHLPSGLSSSANSGFARRQAA